MSAKLISGFYRLFPLLLAVLLVQAGPVCAATGDGASLLRSSVRLHLSYEVLEISPDENLGLAGMRYLVEVSPDWYVGPAAFGALDGERGGFFTGGLSAGRRYRLGPDWFLDAGLFVGGGGGGSAPQGSGLMLRPHLGVSYDLGGVLIDGAVSYITFPDGDIDSTQLSLGFGIPFGLYYGRADAAGRPVSAETLSGVRRRDTEWLATWAEYRPAGSARTTGRSLQESLQRFGFEYRRHLDGRGYLFVETAGAMEGDSDGYMEILAGAGLRAGLLDRWHATAAIAVGGAGGGMIDTGGGLAAKVRLGLDYAVTPTLKLGLEGGRIETDGSFAADFYGLSLGYRIGTAADDRRDREGRGEDRWRFARWRLAAMQHTCFDAARKNGDDRDLGLLGLKIEQFVNRSVYLTGQAYSAYLGEAGGYAVGLIGAGREFRLRTDTRLSLNLELAVGAVGGGGVDAGEGAVIQPLAGLTWRLGRQLGLRLEAGRVKGVTGELDSTMVGIGLAYEFSRPEYG